MSTDSCVIHHLRHDDGTPYATIAYTTRTGDAHTIRFACARCHEGEQFVKKVGRAKAAGRLKSDRQSYTVWDERRDFRTMEHPDIVTFLSGVLYNTLVPCIETRLS